MGIANAIVFPDPVWAEPIQSPPAVVVVRHCESQEGVAVVVEVGKLTS